MRALFLLFLCIFSWLLSFLQKGRRFAALQILRFRAEDFLFCIGIFFFFSLHFLRASVSLAKRVVESP